MAAPDKQRVGNTSERAYGPEATECRSRSCFDAATWVKLYGKSKSSKTSSTSKSNGQSEMNDESHKECPLDKDELGRKTWGFLHTMAANYPVNPSKEQQEDMTKMMHLFSKFYPCEYCAEDFQESLKKDKPDTRNQDTFSQWMCRMHNEVNEKLGKPVFDCSLVHERWRDGWKDGSCD